MRLISSKESIVTGGTTWFAVVETLVAVLSSWGVAWHFGAYRYLLLLVLVAPLLLLRSQDSVRVGARWFSAYLGDRTGVTPQGTPLRFWGVLLPLVVVGTAGCTYELAHALLSGHSGWSLFARAMLLGAIVVWIAISLAVAGAVAGAVVVALVIVLLLAVLVAEAGVAPVALGLAMTVTVAGLLATVVALALLGAVASGGDLVVAVFLAGLPWILGIGLRSLGIRVVAVLRHPLSGLRALPGNWWRTVWVIDSRHPPEVLPGPEPLAKVFSPQTIRSMIHAPEGFERFLGVVLFLLFFFPALCYRWSLKSTLWFYWPLCYLGSVPSALAGHQEEGGGHTTQRGECPERLRYWLAVILLLVMAASTLFPPVLEWVYHTLPEVPAQLYRLAFDLRLQAPWQGCSLLSILLTGLIGVGQQWSSSKSAESLGGPVPHRSCRSCRLVRVRNYCMVAFLLLTLGYTGLILLGVSPRQLPDWLALFTLLYLPYLP